jgi:hypothetical protein
LKTSTFALAAAFTLGLASFTAPASAMSPAPAAVISHGTANISPAAYVVKRTVVRHGPVCTMRKVVRRGPHGRKIVTQTRVCR